MILAKIAYKAKKSSFFKIFGEDGLVAQSVKYTKYVVSDKLSSVYKIRAQKYNLWDLSQKWFFFDGQKSAKKADFGVFGTFSPFFEKFSKILKFQFFNNLSAPRLPPSPYTSKCRHFPLNFEPNFFF